MTANKGPQKTGIQGGGEEIFRMAIIYTPVYKILLKNFKHFNICIYSFPDKQCNGGFYEEIEIRLFHVLLLCPSK